MKLSKIIIASALLMIGVGGAKAENHYLNITTNEAKTNAWDWGISYQLGTPLEVGTTYVLTMDAQCSEDFQLSFWPIDTEANKTQYMGYKVRTDWSECVFEFTAEQALNRLDWDFGSLNGYLRFDNVKLVVKGTTENLIAGGDFENGLTGGWDNTAWNTPERTIAENAGNPKRYLKMKTDAAKTNAWDWAVWYKLDTPLENGKTYVLKMNAKCSEQFNMPFWPYKNGGATTYTGYGIGTDWAECSCTFTAGDDITHLRWCIGSLNGDVCFDDVSLVEQGTTTNLINDGGFDNGMASNWGADSWSSPDYYVALEFADDDPLLPFKVNLRKAIALGEMQTSFGKTNESFGVLTSAIQDGENALNDANATEQSLTNATTAINNAIAGFEYLPGYTTLDLSMYKAWDSPTAPTTSSTAYGGSIALNESTGQPYGHGSVPYNYFADLSEYSNMFINANTDKGVPRVLMNRLVDGGQFSETEADSKMIEMPKNGTWTDQFYSTEGTLFTYDLDKIKADPLQGFVHLNVIKANGNVTVTDLLLYREVKVGTNGYGSFGSLDKAASFEDATAYAGVYNADKGTVTLTEVAAVPAGTGVILKGTEGTTIKPTFIASAEAVTSDLKVSNGTVTSDGTTIYALATMDGVTAFYLVGEGVTIPAGKAYLQITGASHAPVIRFGDDIATGINNILPAHVQNSAVYNLNGQRVVNATKGLFIVNGKKVIK